MASTTSRLLPTLFMKLGRWHHAIDHRRVGEEVVAPLDWPRLDLAIHLPRRPPRQSQPFDASQPGGQLLVRSQLGKSLITKATRSITSRRGNRSCSIAVLPSNKPRAAWPSTQRHHTPGADLGDPCNASPRLVTATSSKCTTNQLLANDMSN